jgi:hypothetical protein
MTSRDSAVGKRKGVDKSLAFPTFPFAAQRK